MARYGREYDRDYGRWRQPGPPIGGMRSDGWGGTADWRNFPGQEGWYGEGYEGMPNFAYDMPIRGEERLARRGWNAWPEWGDDATRYGARESDPERSRALYWSGTSGYAARPRDAGRSGRDIDYSEGWDDSWTAGRTRSRALGGFFGRGSARAGDLMTENPQTVTPDSTLSEVARKMKDLDVGIIPVVDSTDTRRLRGVITDRDIAIRAIAEGKDGSARVADCMTADVRAVNKNDSVLDVMRVMRQDQVRRVPVTDREGRLVGIIAQADLAVDYGAGDQEREREVGETLERISEPAEPRMRGGMTGTTNAAMDRPGRGRSRAGTSRLGTTEGE